MKFAFFNINIYRLKIFHNIISFCIYSSLFLEAQLKYLWKIKLSSVWNVTHFFLLRKLVDAYYYKVLKKNLRNILSSSRRSRELSFFNFIKVHRWDFVKNDYYDCRSRNNCRLTSCVNFYKTHNKVLIFWNIFWITNNTFHKET